MLWFTAAATASACTLPPDARVVERYYTAAKAKATLVVVGRLELHRKGAREFGLLTPEKVLKGTHKKAYVVTYQTLLCTYRMPQMKRAVFYMEAVPGGFQLLATSPVK